MSSCSKLSIVVPVYNTGKYLARCLDSILSQSHKNLEVIVVNDCSPDKAADIIQEYQLADERVKCCTHEVNKGLFQARLTGAAQADGDYIAFVDSDDYLSADYYREMIECADREECDIVAGSTTRVLCNGRMVQYTLHKICFGSEKLVGDQVRSRFYGQKGSCYAWHTVWNKIYRKSLWDKCAEEYARIDGHLIMTEDIAFSSVLFYNAQSFKALNSASSCYYYCDNIEASTNASQLTFKKFQKNMKDLITVFDFVDSFLASAGATETIRSDFSVFRRRYYQMWKHAQEDLFMLGKEGTIAAELVQQLGKGLDTKKNVVFPSFDTQQSIWYPEVEMIRERIADPDIEVVSFDIFDTLLLRPLWNPDDLFLLMQGRFEQLCPAFAHTSFKTLRQAAENKARGDAYYMHNKAQDITLDEIYDEMQASFEIPAEAVRRLQKYEEQMEIFFSQERKTAKLLFEYAKACGKRVILTSDMYLKKETIEAMLRKNGYTGYEKLFLSSAELLTKNSGKLFDRAASVMKVPTKKILHIGDNWDHDIMTAREKGWQSAFLPKTKDRFSNNIASAPTNSLGAIGNLVGFNLTTWNKTNASIGYRAMMQMVANKFFDNSYASWNPLTDFDVNPYVMGYYAVGMHLVGLAKWISDIIKRRGISKVCFLARDGLLPKMAFEALQQYFDVENVETAYVPCSRKCLMPWMIVNKEGLYALPIEFRNHSPLSLVKLLKKYTRDYDDSMLMRIVYRAGFAPDVCFAEEKEYHKFIKWYTLNLFDADKFEKEKQIVSAYYREQIPAGSLVFDLGYSGRILSAIQKALQYPVTYAYVHEDNESFSVYRRRDELDVEVMYQHIPPYSDLIREYFLSEVGNSCTGFVEQGGKIVPQYTDTDISYDEQFVPEQIMRGAREFVTEFAKNYMPVKDELYFDPVNVSLPFEGLIHSSLPADREILSLSYSDDTVYGADDRISMADFWKNQQDSCYYRPWIAPLPELPDPVVPEAEAPQSQAPAMPAPVQGNTDIAQRMQGKSKLTKAVVYWFCDRERLKVAVKKRLASKPKLLYAVKKVYRMGRGK